MEYFAKDERMHYLHRNREPKGPQTCRNIGLENARGEFIIFFDSDDQVFPFTLKKRVEALRSREDLDFMVFPSGVLFNGNFSDTPKNAMMKIFKAELLFNLLLMKSVRYAMSKFCKGFVRNSIMRRCVSSRSLLYGLRQEWSLESPYLCHIPSR